MLQYLEGSLGRSARRPRHLVSPLDEAGFEALEEALGRDPARGRFCYGDTPTLADVCLVPQVFNARRFALDLGPYPRIVSVEAACAELPAFKSAAPERQPQ